MNKQLSFGSAMQDMKQGHHDNLINWPMLKKSNVECNVLPHYANLSKLLMEIDPDNAFHASCMEGKER